MQYSVHAPSPFIHKHCNRLLPDWSSPAASVLVVLQPCSGDLLQLSDRVELQKHTLRQQFLVVGYTIASRLQQLGHLADVFDPKTGLPLMSPAGSLPLDDVAIAHACLGYRTIAHADCFAIVHPIWGSSVYPSTLLSSASPDIVEQVCDRVMHDRVMRDRA